MKSITEEIAALREMNVAELVERYAELHGRPPRTKHKEWLWRRCAWRLQELRFGGLSEVARRRIDELIADLDVPLGTGRSVREKIQRATKPGTPQIGTTITRTWRGRELRVTVMENGFAYDDVIYRSLSAVANRITGGHVSGKAFFKLTERKAAK